MKSFIYRLEDDAINDFVESFDFYEDRQMGLGVRFKDEVKENLEIIQRHPLSFSILFRNARKKSLDKFPFQIIYTVDEDKYEIAVIAIWHSRRNPDLLKSRI
ncbi:MAG TPA: type II toxin-antitoxin system RelE/ParE family toxin [Chitinophagales bacterium]|nr:type II toxin-antitoxin system RelE/ParE family toxin [Chitinophagales bacterium]